MVSPRGRGSCIGQEGDGLSDGAMEESLVVYNKGTVSDKVWAAGVEREKGCCTPYLGTLQRVGGDTLDPQHFGGSKRERC